MISATRLHRLLKVLRPLLVNMGEKERQDMVDEIENALGYDVKKLAKLRAAAKERNSVVENIVSLRLGES
jgi:hypothetical protein